MINFKQFQSTAVTSTKSLLATLVLTPVIAFAQSDSKLAESITKANPLVQSVEVFKRFESQNPKWILALYDNTNPKGDSAGMAYALFSVATDKIKFHGTFDTFPDAYDAIKEPLAQKEIGDAWVKSTLDNFGGDKDPISAFNKLKENMGPASFGYQLAEKYLQEKGLLTK